MPNVLVRVAAPATLADLPAGEHGEVVIGVVVDIGDGPG
jgi:hypothetical protein